MLDGANCATRTKPYLTLVELYCCSSTSLTYPLQFIGARVSEMRSQMNSGKFVDPEKKSMLQRLIQYRNSSTNEPMSDQHIVSEAVGHTYVVRSFL